MTRRSRPQQRDRLLRSRAGTRPLKPVEWDLPGQTTETKSGPASGGEVIAGFPREQISKSPSPVDYRFRAGFGSSSPTKMGWAVVPAGVETPLPPDLQVDDLFMLDMFGKLKWGPLTVAGAVDDAMLLVVAHSCFLTA